MPTDCAITRALASHTYPQSLSNLPHRQSLGGHQTSLCESQKKDRARLRLPTTLPESPHQQGGRIRSDQVVAFDRINDREHFLSDVVTGALFATATGRFLVHRHRQENVLVPDESRTTVQVVPIHDGAAVRLSW